MGSATLVALILAGATGHVVSTEPHAAQVATTRSASPSPRPSASARPSGSASPRPASKPSVAPSLAVPAASPKPTPKPTPSSRPSPTPPTPTGPVLYLTFDDGPDPRWTPSVLAVLAKHKAHATFFEVGVAARRSPDLVASVRKAGHGVGNHSMTHPSLTKLSAAGVASEISQADKFIGGSACMRPPYGAVNKSVRNQIAAEGKRMVLWDVDTNDWQLPGADVIASRVIEGAKPGAIVLMHDGGGKRSQTIAALDTVLTRLGTAGWRFERLPNC